MTDIINIDNLNDKELELLQTKLILKKQSFLEQQIKKTQEQLLIQDAKIEIMEQNKENEIQLAIHSLRVQEGRYDYVTLKDFGKNFTTSIGSKTIGKLLRIVGLAQQKNTTEPYRHHIPKYARHRSLGKYSTVDWHYENCITQIENWLRDRNLFEKFYSIENEKKLQEFINDLYKKI